MRRFSTTSKTFAQDFWAFLHGRAEPQEDVRTRVAEIIAAVRSGGEQALIDYTKKFDRWEANAETLLVTPQETANALSLCAPELMKSLKAAAARIRAYSERQIPEDAQWWIDETGMRLGWKWSAIDAVGLYVPGGTAAYPSSVLMNAVPAKVAGVSRLAMAVPAPEGKLNPAVLAAAHVAGVTEIYKIGGAQAIAALAYGAGAIVPVDKIVGPGNAYVAEAKRQVFGQVGIDMIAGPSEILVIADSEANAEWIAADLLSQAEHDVLAQAILVTPDSALAGRAEKAVKALLKKLPRREIAQAAWDQFGALVLTRDLAEAVEVANAVAPEHLELAVAQPQVLLSNIRHAGAVFLGHHTPEAIGDYVAGPSHVLPTSRTARFSSGLSVLDFMKRTSLMGCSPESFKAIGMYAEVLATQEGLDAHALSVKIRGGG